MAPFDYTLNGILINRHVSLFLSLVTVYKREGILTELQLTTLANIHPRWRVIFSSPNTCLTVCCFQLDCRVPPWMQCNCTPIINESERG